MPLRRDRTAYPSKLGRFRATLFLIASVVVGNVQAQPRDEPVSLPAYTVVEAHELPPPEKWLYARVGGLEIISSGTEAATRHLVRDFQRFRQALDLVWPDVQRTNAKLGALIICGKARQLDAFKPAVDKGMPPVLLTVTLRNEENAWIVFDLSTKALVPGLLGDEADAGDLRGLGDTYRQLYRAYLRMLLASAQPRAPAWFEEGLAQLLMAMRITDRDVVVGQLGHPNETREADGSPVAVQDLDFNAVLTRRRLVPLGEFLSLGHDSYDANNAVGNVWGKQAYAFVHWGLYGDGGKHQKAFVTFLARLARQPVSEELFQRTFGQSYDKMGYTLRGYSEMTIHRIAGVEAERGYKLPPPAPFELRDATEAEAGRIKGEALLVAGKPNLAREAMSLPYRRRERDPDLLAAIGLLELGQGEASTARTFLEMAAAGKPTRSRALVELAKLRLADALAKPDAPPDRLSAAQVGAVLTPLFAARNQPPLLPELYETLARVWESSAVTPEPAHLAVLDEAAKHFPRKAELIYRIAALKLRIALYDDASVLIALGLQSADDPETRARFTALKAGIPLQN